MLNFASPFQRMKKMSKTRRRVIVALFISFGVVLLIGIVIAIWIASNVKTMKSVYAESISAKQSLEYAQVALSNQNFDLAARDLDEAREHFSVAQQRLSLFQSYRFLPGLSAQITAVDSVLTAGVNLSSGMKSLAEIGGRVFAVLQRGDESGSFSELSAEDKRAMLQVLAESTVDLHGVRSEIELAVLALEEIPTSGLLKPVREAVEPIQAQIPLLDTLMNRLLPTAQLLPSILGYPDDKTYLFLLQNNRELRPTGGFIGTYGILKVDAGEFDITTDNIYNLDNPASSYITEPSPGPIAQHTTTQNWLLRNINWSPDFPTTARKAESKYHEEGGPEEHLDGVLAVTPTFIESLLGLVGPITVDGVTFTQENFFETLQYEVEFAYYDKGISDSDRKAVIGHLSKELMQRLLNLPRNRFPEIWQVFIDNVDQKHILIYVDEPLIQELVRKNNWSGEMKQAESDYVMVVDANLAALKTDEKMERSIAYSIKPDGDSYRATLDITYHNTTQRISEFYTRYRTYTRVYVPQGAELISATGYMTNDININGRVVPVQPSVSQETFEQEGGDPYTYTVIGGFTSIEPKETRTLHLEYRLPTEVVNDIRAGTYSLLMQKQPGTAGHGLTIDMQIGKKAEDTRVVDMTAENSDNSLLLRGDLSRDRVVTFDE